MGFGIKANMVRKGNTVMCSLVRGIYSASGGIEYKELNEKMPEGFRPVVETNLNASKNVGGNQIGVATWHLLPNGNINLTNQSDTKAVYNGTVSYITQDNYPN